MRTIANDRERLRTFANDNEQWTFTNVLKMKFWKAGIVNYKNNIDIYRVFIFHRLFSKSEHYWKERRKRREREWVYVCIWVNESEIGRYVARILCEEHNIRTESCDCEHRVVLAGQQSKDAFYRILSRDFVLFFRLLFALLNNKINPSIFVF